MRGGHRGAVLWPPVEPRVHTSKMAGLEEQSDQQLIRRCLKGDQRAWEVLILRYERLIYSIPVRYSFDQDARADIFQTVSLRLLEQLSHLRDRSKLASWLITTTLRECWKRKRERARLISDAEAWPEGEEPSEQARAVEERQLWEEQHLVRQALQSMDERCRRLFDVAASPSPRPADSDPGRSGHCQDQRYCKD